MKFLDILPRYAAWAFRPFFIAVFEQVLPNCPSSDYTLRRIIRQLEQHLLARLET